MMAIVACVYTSGPLPSGEASENFRKLTSINDHHNRSFLSANVLNNLSEKEVVDAILDYMKKFRDIGPKAEPGLGLSESDVYRSQKVPELSGS